MTALVAFVLVIGLVLRIPKPQRWWTVQNSKRLVRAGGALMLLGIPPIFVVGAASGEPDDAFVLSTLMLTSARLALVGYVVAIFGIAHRPRPDSNDPPPGLGLTRP